MPRLTTELEAAGRDALDRRLDPRGAAPIAVAFSGGADSLLTLLTAAAWADRHGRRLLVLSVDHRIQPQSAAWTVRCAETARPLGLEFRALAWDGPKSQTGLPAAARTARHRLLADAARAAGARVILLGHTASDAAEGEVMREEGSNIGTLREWSPSPAWPEGRGLFCLRPLMDLTREQVRARLAAAGWDWIDDPANEDLRFGRPRARKALQTSARPRDPKGGEDEKIMEMARRVRFEPAGSATLPQDLAADPAFPQLLQILLLCVSGGETPARGARVEALARRLPASATLGGCRIAARDGEILVARELGRAPPAPLPLPEGRPVVWDGRFQLTALSGRLEVRPLKGLAARLTSGERAALAAIPAPARPGLPAVISEGDQTVTCPFLAEGPLLRARTLAADRFAAACGLIAHEGAI